MVLVIPFLLSLLLAITVNEAADSGDIKQYSYICLGANQKLCLGISPGNGEPYYDPNYLFEIQVKNRVNNEYSGDDYKKTRWDVNFDTSQISLSRFSNLCMARPSNTNKGILYLLPCDAATSVTKFELTFNQNINQEGVLKLKGTDMCATVMKCNPPQGQTYCDSLSSQPAIGTDLYTFNAGAYVKLRPCYDTTGGLLTWKDAQVWRQRLDCAVGCSPYLQYNDECDLACANEQCGWDGHHCITQSPTPPTPKPTRNPTSKPTKRPTIAPTLKPTKAPSSNPTLKPTLSPTNKPTLKPSDSPTKRPTASPTKRPTATPTINPTRSPSSNPTASPTPFPTTSPTKKPTNSPTISPTPRPSLSPTTTPTREPTKPPIVSLAVAEKTASPTTPAPTNFYPQDIQTWLLITLLPALALLLLCCLFFACFYGCCCCCKRKNKDEKEKEKEPKKESCACTCCAKEDEEVASHNPSSLASNEPVVDIGAPTNVRRNNMAVEIV